MLSYLRLLLQLFIELLYDVILVVVEQRQVLYVHVGIFQFLLQVGYFTFLLLHDHQLGVNVLGRDIRYL